MTNGNNLLGKFELSGIPPAPRGVPKIEITYDIDANGIMQINAVDKTTGKTEKITITNDKGRLSKDEIDRMVHEAEKYADEDKKMKERVESKNHFESYIYQMKNTLKDEKVASKISESDKKTINNTIDSALKWAENKQNATKEEFEAKQKEIEGIFQPIMTKMYQGGDQGFHTQQGGFGGPTGTTGPSVDEID